MTTDSSIAKLQNYFYWLLGKRDYASAELVEKALQKGYAGVDIKTVIQELTQSNMVNDRRLAQNLIEHYQGSKGKLWIQARLQKRRVPREISQELLQDVEMQVDDSLKNKVTNKYKITDWQNIDPAIRVKMTNYLARQGFGNAWEIIKKWSLPED